MSFVGRFGLVGGDSKELGEVVTFVVAGRVQAERGEGQQQALGECASFADRADLFLRAARAGFREFASGGPQEPERFRVRAHRVDSK